MPAPPSETGAARSAPPDAFGRTAEEYELGRPSWPEELLDRVVGELGLGRDGGVLDLGAGTGKLTRLLVRRFRRVVAVEPDAAMRALLEQVVPEAESLAGSAEAIPLEPDSVDCVFSAEAFHWFATSEVLAEIARVLRPGGGLVLLWNVPVGETSPPLSDEAQTAIWDGIERGGKPGLPRVLSGEWRKPFEGAPFEELRGASFEHEVAGAREQLLASILSISSVAAQPEDDRRAFAQQLRELVPDAEYRRRLRTDAYWTRLWRAS